MESKLYDAVVIGSGAGGGPCAYGLAVRGKKVLLLEAGPRYDPYKDYNLDKNDWEIRKFPDREKGIYTFGEGQPLKEELDHLRSRNRGEGLVNPTQKRKYLAFFHVKGVGGSTLRYQGEAHRLHPRAFRIRSLYGAGNDWPLSYDDLDPYYEAAEKILGVAGPEADPLRPRKNPLPLPPHRLSYASQIIKGACAKLGMKLVPNTLAILSKMYDERPYCNYCNGCADGCPRKDKGSIDVTFIPKAEATGNCTVQEGAHVFRLLANKGKIEEVLYYDNEKTQRSVRAKAVVVACGAIETPRLLLNSGIANGSGQVGKNFMETLVWLGTALHPKRTDNYRGMPIDSEVLDHLFPEPGRPFVSGCRLFSVAGPTNGPLSFAYKYFKGWGKEFQEEMKRYFGHALTVGGVGEFLPNKDTFVTVDERQMDRFGVPAAKIQAYLGENEIKILDFISARCKEILKTAGAGDLIDELSSYDLFMATHVFGTCIMGKDPGSSVVDPSCRSHEISNLFVADSSVFPSSGGGSSPSLTISAIGLRTADYIAGQDL
jgi:choline dehydrogenase-like flavoprotein